MQRLGWGDVKATVWSLPCCIIPYPGALIWAHHRPSACLGCSQKPKETKAYKGALISYSLQGCQRQEVLRPSAVL